MSTPLVTVVVPVYCVEMYIARCAKSLLEQTWKNIELIFVDDCSPDASMSILSDCLNSYTIHASTKIKIIHHSKNKGLAHARQTGYAAATGEYLLNVDSDDYLESDAISLLVQCAQNRNADIVVFNSLIHKTGNVILKMNQTIPTTQDDYLLSALSRKKSNSLWGKLFKKDLLDKVHLLLPEYCNFGEDYLVFPQILRHSKRFTLLSKNLYHYDQTVTSSATFVPSPKAIDEIFTVFALLKKVFSEEKYQSALTEGQISCITSMLKQICINDNCNEEKIKLLVNYLGNKYTSLSLPDKIFYYLIIWKCQRVAALYLRLARYIKNLPKRIKA